jgi:hypothetical protein
MPSSLTPIGFLDQCLSMWIILRFLERVSSGAKIEGELGFR